MSNFLIPIYSRSGNTLSVGFEEAGHIRMGFKCWQRTLKQIRNALVAIKIIIIMENEPKTCN